MTSHPSPWSLAPECLLLERGGVHVWRASLVQSPLNVHSFRQILAPDELGRAERFHFQKDRERFIIGRGVLRVLLSRYLHVKPDQLRFSYGRYGKPALVAGSGADVLWFNLSHSHELALIAITRRREVGIDLEYIREDFASEALADQLFSREEARMLRTLPSKLRTESFFKFWVRKEAYIKGQGLNLHLPMKQSDILRVPQEQAALSNTRQKCEASRWSLLDLAVDIGYAAAIAVQDITRQRTRITLT